MLRCAEPISKSKIGRANKARALRGAQFARSKEHRGRVRNAAWAIEMHFETGSSVKTGYRAFRAVINQG